MQRIEIKNPNGDCLDIKCLVDGKEVKFVQSVDFHAGVDDVPTFTFNTIGISYIDVMGRAVFDPSPTNLQEACTMITNELLKHGEFYNSFVASVKSAIKEAPNEVWGNELAEKIVKRISGEG